MIVTEERIKDIIAQIPYMIMKIQLHRKPSFHWGDEKELNRYLKMKKDESYPLVWLLPGKEVFRTDGTVRRKCEFIIATRETRTELFNTERYEKSYRIVLNPLAEYLMEGLQTSSVSHFTSDEWSLFRHPNYSVDEKKNGTIDLWDAIKLICEVEFNNNCLNTIEWQT